MTARSLRILLTSHVRNDPDAGSSRVFHMLDDGLRTLGHEVVTVHREDFPLTQRLGRIADRVVLPQTMSWDARLLDPLSFDVIMAPSGVLYPLFRRLRPLRDRPLLVEFLHGSAFFDHFATVEEAARGHLKTSLTYRLLTGDLPLAWDLKGSRAADMLAVSSGRDFDFMVDQGIPEENCVRIPLGLHTELLEHALAQAGTAERAPQSVLWFGSWSDRKGISYLPRAWRAVRQRFPDATLTLGGVGHSAALIVEAFAPEDRESLRILGRISVAQHMDELDRHQIFLFPSLSEGFGFALLEAMACGLAPVATFTGMGADFLRDRQNALIIPPASSLHMAQAVNALLEDGELLAKVGATAARDARTLTVDRMARSYAQAFFEHIDRRAAGSLAG